MDKQELAQLKSKIWRMEKDLSNAALDQKIIERDLKESKEEKKKLSGEITDLNNKLDETKKNYEAALVELGELNDSLATQVLKLKDVTKSLEGKLVDQNEKCQSEKKLLAELQNTIVARDGRIKVLESTISNLERDKIIMNGKLVENRDENVKIQTEIANVKQQNVDLSNDLKNCRESLENAQLVRILLI